MIIVASCLEINILVDFNMSITRLLFYFNTSACNLIKHFSSQVEKHGAILKEIQEIQTKLDEAKASK